ncbi:MAG: 3-oxoacyl-ACP synthase [Bacteroidota bacterium]
MERIITSYCHLHDHKVIVNDRLLFYQENITKFAEILKAVYKQEKINYPKFYKMDAISKLGFMAAELVLKDKTIEGYRPETVGVVLSNSSSSLDTDITHNETIKDRSAYYPSPSVFVYTLPNIVIGEVCIRHKIKGENAFLISEAFNSKMLSSYAEELFINRRVDACLCGWIEVLGDKFNALAVLVENDDRGRSGEVSGFKPLLFNEKNLNLLMTHN